jgi:MFS family permease
MVLGIPSLVFGISEVGTTGTFNSPEVIWPVIAGLVLIGAFIRHAYRAERPLLDVRLYANRVFGAASLTTFALGAALFGAMILMPLYYQQIRGESVIATGLLLAPQGLGMLMVGPFAPRLTERFGGGKVATFGVAVLSLGSLPFVFIGVDTSIAFLSLMLLVRGIGIGLAFMPTMTVAYASLRKDQLSDATPQMNVIQRVGGAIGTAVLAVVLQQASEGATTATAAAQGFGTAYLWALGIALLALIPCVVLWRAEMPAGPVTEEERIAEVEIEPLGA